MRLIKLCYSSNKQNEDTHTVRMLLHTLEHVAAALYPLLRLRSLHERLRLRVTTLLALIALLTAAPFFSSSVEALCEHHDTPQGPQAPTCALRAASKACHVSQVKRVAAYVSACAAVCARQLCLRM